MKPRDCLVSTSTKWPILRRVGRESVGLSQCAAAVLRLSTVAEGAMPGVAVRGDDVKQCDLL